MKKILGSILICIVINSSICYPQDTIILQSGPEEGKDVKTRMLAPNTNYGNFRDITAHATDWLGPNISRSYIKFDLSFLPEETEVYDAKLSLYITANLPNYPPGQFGENESVLQMVTEDWDELGVTFNEQPSATSIGQVHLPASIHGLQHYEDIEITYFVQEWVQNPDSNFGLMLKLKREIPNRTLCFASSDYENPELRPKLEIVIGVCLINANFTYERIEDKYYFYDESDSAETWYWDFGDGNFSTLQNPVYTYLNYGKYDVCLNVTNSCGEDTKCDSINYCPHAQAYFKYMSSNDTVYFISLSNNTNKWTWDFGDGYGTTIENPFHYYHEYDTYIVCLTAENECSIDEYCDTLIINNINKLFKDKFINVSLFPNPSCGKITISINGGNGKVFPLVLYDLSGKKILEMNNQITGDSEREIDISGLRNGIYIIKIDLGNNSVIRKIQLLKD